MLSYCHNYNNNNNIVKNHKIVKNLNWHEADQLTILMQPRSWTRSYRETTPASGQNKCPNHLTTLPPTN